MRTPNSRVVVALAVFAAALACRTANVPRAPTPVAQLHDDVAWLADDAQQGRRAGTSDARRASDWIALRLVALGLEPAGEMRTYFQKFEVPLPVEVGPNSSVVGASQPGDVAPLFCSSGGGATGDLAWRGYGIISAEKGWNDYAERVDGRVVVIVRGTPPAPKADAAPQPAEGAHGGNVQAGDTWGNSGTLFLKVMNAKKNGAVAVLVAPHPSHADEALPEFDHSRVAQAGIPALAISFSLAKQLIPNYARAVAAIDAGADEPRAHVAGSVRVEADVKREKGAAFNVLARLPGANSDRCVVVGAHYDHLGTGGEGSLAPSAQGQVHNGADDNASGTAAVLEMARAMKAVPQPACDVIFALWSGEELGLLGSEYWAQHPTVRLERVKANLNLDMVGRAGDGQLAALGAGTAEPFGAWLRELGPMAGLELKISGSGQGVGGSDHQTFTKRKIPAVHFFSGVHADYHKPTDDIERFEAEGAAKVAKLGAALIEKMCAAEGLAWTEPPAPESTSAPQASAFRVWFGTVPEYSFEGPGLLLAGTSAGSPAEKAGMLAGDVVHQVGDIAIESINDFMYALQTYKVGDVVLTKFTRDGKDEEVRVTLSTREAQ